MGVVEEIGNGVTLLKKGERIVLPFNVADGRCQNCEEGKTAFCTGVNPGFAGGAYGYVAMGPYQGGQVKHPLLTEPNSIITLFEPLTDRLSGSIPPSSLCGFQCPHPSSWYRPRSRLCSPSRYLSHRMARTRTFRLHSRRVSSHLWRWPCRSDGCL